jgi:hypothetical protein
MREDRSLRGSDEIVGAAVLATSVGAGDPQINGSAAIERTMLLVRELPDAIHVDSRDGVIRTPESAICTDSEISAANENGRLAVQPSKSQCDQLELMNRPSS